MVRWDRPPWDNSEGTRCMQSTSASRTALREQCWQNHPYVSQNSGSHTASCFMLFASKTEWARKGLLLLRETSSLVAKRRPLMKLCPFGRGFQKSLLAITRSSHLMGHTRSHPPVQANVPVTFIWPRRSLSCLIEIHF